MAATTTGACISAESPVLHRYAISRRNFRRRSLCFLGSTRRRALAWEYRSVKWKTPISKTTTIDAELGKDEKGCGGIMEEDPESSRFGLKDFIEIAESLVRSNDGGPPRWFSPLGRSSRLSDYCPLLLYLPGIDGTGAGLALQQKGLAKVFDIWCMHIPLTDRTPFTGLVDMVEKTVVSESNRCPEYKPIYIVGESVGACIALAVAARNPNLDLILILANPATYFDESPLQSQLVPLLKIMPQLIHPFLLSLMTGLHMSLHHSRIFADILLSDKTLTWKLHMLRSASEYTNQRLHVIKAQILLLISGKDRLLPISAAEASRLYRALPGCDVRKFNKCGHFLFLENGINLMTIVKTTHSYRHGKSFDFITDYLPPTLSEISNLSWTTKIMSPVMLSTLEDGKIVKGLAGVPLEGPVIYVGYHMLMGLELVPLVTIEKNIILRGLAHPMMSDKYKEGFPVDPSEFNTYKLLGAVPVSGFNMFKLLKHKSHVLLYPGGSREALHRKGEQYKLIWPEEAEFVRMAARFGAKIVPFGVVGEDDIAEVIFDYDDFMKIPFFRSQIENFNKLFVNVRTDSTGEVAHQEMHVPGIMPKIPGRFYYLFGKPIETQGRMKELRDREISQELYLQVKSEVEECITYLKQKREEDPYRSIFSRAIYRAIHGMDSQIPTFEV